MYPNIEIDNHHMLCISRIWTIVDTHSGYTFLIPIPDNFKAEQCTGTNEVHLLPYVGYPNIIVFDRVSLFMSDHFQAWAASKGILLEASTAYHQQTDGETEIVNKEVVAIVRACELEGDQRVKKLPEIQLKLNSRYNSSRGSSPCPTLYGFTPRFGQAQMPYPLNKIVADTDRHAQVIHNLKIAKERQSFQANKRRNQRPRWKIGQQVMLSSQNINLPNLNKKIKPRWLGAFPITQVNYNGNNYTRNLDSNFDLHHIHNTLHIGLLKPYPENIQQVFPERHYAEPGPVKDDRYDVETAVNFRFSHPARDPLYQIRWKRYLPSDDQWIHADEIDDDMKFRFGKKKIWNQPSQEEGAIAVVQDLEREVKHFQKSKEKGRR